MTKRLFLVGGSAGAGKTETARRLARRLDAGWLQLDTVWIAMKAAAPPGSPTYDVLDIDGRMRRGPAGSDDDLLEAHIAASEAVCAGLPEVFAFELETHEVLVADGAWLLPSFVAGLELTGTDVRYICLHHADTAGLEAALRARRGVPLEERHRRLNRYLWQYGDWLAQQSRLAGFAVVDPLPFETLPDRVSAVLAD
jgi:2-phosphoglycerate kinase